MNFDVLVDFFTKNWQFISTAILIVAYLLSVFISRKKKVVVEDGLLARIYTDAIDFINVAENKFVNGEDKLKYVVSCLVEKYPNYSDYINSINPSWCKVDAKSCFAALIERILETPQKKGDKNGKRS